MFYEGQIVVNKENEKVAIVMAVGDGLLCVRCIYNDKMEVWGDKHVRCIREEVSF